MNIIRIDICSVKNYSLHSKFTRYSKNKARRIFSSDVLPNHQYGKLQKGFDIISTILRQAGSSNLGFTYFQIFKYIEIFEYIHEYFLKIIFLLIFVTQGVKKKFIFVFV